MAKVLLVYPNMHGMNMLPPAIALFYTLLKTAGHNVALFDTTDYQIQEEGDFNSDQEKAKNLNARPFDATLLEAGRQRGDVHEDFDKAVSAFRPDLIALSVTEDMFSVGLGLLQRARSVRVPVIVGGVFPTFAPELVLSFKEIDMICRGEGEHVLPELCARLDRGVSYDDVPGLWVKKADGTVRRNPMAALADVNTQPLLDFSLFAETRFYRPMQGRVWRMFPVETHRGCPYGCAYCNSPSQSALYREEQGETFFRKRKAQKVREELRHYIDTYKADSFYFWADTFFAYSDDEFDAFCRMYAEFKLPFWCQTRAETITEERVRKLKEVGLMRFGFGIEHGNDDFRRRVLHRQISNKKMLEAFQIVHKAGVPFSVNNILGFPTETRELAMDTVELNRLIPADSVNAYSYCPFHGTPLRALAEELGFVSPGELARSLTRPTLLQMPQFAPEAIEGLRRCFVLYVKMPRDRWPDIRRAEALTPEGNRLWAQLRDECAEKYMDWSTSGEEDLSPP